MKDKSLKKWLTTVSSADQFLGEFYKVPEYQNDFDQVFVEALNIDLSIATIETSNKTQKEVYWFNRYGLQSLNEKGSSFRILCRNSI